MQYEKIKYPDGQISVKITNYDNPHIVERINSYEDLIFVKSIAEAYHYHGGTEYPAIKPLTIFIPCLFGQRSDRRFSPNQSFDLKIITDIINSCNFSRVDILENHSDVCMALINNSNKVSSFEYIKETTGLVYDITKYLVLVSPDSGAYKRTFLYGEHLKLPVVAANKYRDLDGKITLTFAGDVKDRNCLITDDCADGGYTFILLAKALKEQGASSVYLYVTHGFFNKGFEELKKYINHVYCTNSVKDINDPFVTQFKVV